MGKNSDNCCLADRDLLVDIYVSDADGALVVATDAETVIVRIRELEGSIPAASDEQNDCMMAHHSIVVVV